MPTSYFKSTCQVDFTNNLHLAVLYADIAEFERIEQFVSVSLVTLRLALFNDP